VLINCQKSINSRAQVRDAKQKDRNDLISARTATTSTQTYTHTFTNYNCK